MTAPDLDVVVVGAGFTGLTAATALVQAGYRVAVVEARDRIGGKTDSVLDTAGRRVDIGGQFLCDDMTELQQLAADAGDRFVDVREDGDEVDLIAGTRHRRPAGTGPFVASDAFLDDLTAEVAGDRSVAEWCDGLGADALVVSAVRSELESVWCHRLEDLALAPLVEFAERTPLTVTEMQGVLAGSIHARALALAAGLPTVLLDQPVRSIEQEADAVTVHTADHVLRARRVVVAVPPPALAGIGFTPDLPGDHRRAAASFEMGHVIKIVLRFGEAFWRPAGLSGVVRTIDPGGIYITSACGDTEPATVVVFVAGPVAQEWSPLLAEQRAERVLALLRAAVGDAGVEVPEPVEVIEHEWSPDAYGAGGYCAVPLVGGLPDAIDVLRRPVGAVYLASTELAPQFPGYVEGAIRAGRDVAREVAQALATDRPAPPV